MSLITDYEAIQTVLLDMDGTLLDLHFDSYFWNEYLPIRFAEIHGRDSASAREHVATSLKAAEGTLAWYCIDHWSDHFELDIINLKHEITHLIGYRPGTEHFLKRLQESDRQVILVTNAHPHVLALKHDHTDVLSYFEHKVTSHDFGEPKESQAFWQAFHQAHDFDPSRTMMIDDSHAVLGAAALFGIAEPLFVRTPDSKQGPRQADYRMVDDLSELVT